MKKIYFVFLFSLLATISFSQNVSISANSGDTPDPSAILDVKSTTMGILIPRLTSAQRDAMPNKVEGLQIYNTSRKCIEIYTGTEWASQIPAGTIQIYAGDTTKIPTGWLLCRGQAIDRVQYKDLWDVIGIYWGQGNGNSTFNLPDLRGMFLRGANGTRTSTFVDPDLNNRTANGLGHKNNAGSLQEDAFQGHRHSADYQVLIYNYPSGTFGSVVDNGFSLSNFAAIMNSTHISDEIHGVPKVSFETRPKNAYVNYIIKY
jgi:hypothetical protein